jgi:hypothetical protein
VEEDPGLLAGGAFVWHKSTMPHIVVLGKQLPIVLRAVLIHEIAHVLLYRRRLPLWLNEGICQWLEKEAGRCYHGRIVRHWDLTHEHWRREGLGGFWTGHSFRGRERADAYALALRIVKRLLAADKQVFIRFARMTREDDSGEAACREAYGCSLGEVAADLLGKGEWDGPPAQDPPKGYVTR